jgi:DNA-directed RNA polymerase subunit RPC12/RpoP
MADEAEIRKYGVEPDPEHYIYDANSCSWCGQPVLIVQSRERASGYRSEKISCEYCMSKLAKRTKAKEFRWVFLPGWRPEQS